MLSRRALLIGATAAACAATAPRRLMADDDAPFYVGARLADEGAFVTAFDGSGSLLCDLAMPARGHGFATQPRTGHVIAFARRPGRFALEFDPQAGRVLRTIEAAPGRRFCGHGLFARGGALLVATELEHATGDGLLGLYDAQAGYRRIGEWRSGGLDPHEAVLLPDGVTLAVANGGILTDPDAPGIKLNRDALDSSLAYIDLRDGTLVARLRLPQDLAQLSLRHLAMTRDGTVVVAMQYEGPSHDLVPLVATHRLGEKDLRILGAEDGDLARLRNYCGSIAFDGTERVLAVTSPVGGVVGFWDMDARHHVGAAEMRDVCGLARSDRVGRFLVSSGLDGMAWTGASERHPRALRGDAVAGMRWDNHLLRIG